jgi:hypothetical protein
MTIDNKPVGSYLLLERDGGERLRFLGQSNMRLKIACADTADALSFYEYVSEPGVTGPPQRATSRCDCRCDGAPDAWVRMRWSCQYCCSL